ncbi:MAG: PQQ-dependent sugar dehydrogenase [Flavobacteriales bacterium TMED191]|nr:MAG: PQQ-dependent sugar dehydrogenase [Flavobacteriales bacterium TMED191]|tara:strand:+ start:1437 stop:2768 length:1332 start_codon:yes stop_codon:yes gene_type:complete
MKNILIITFLSLGFINAQVQVGSTVLQEREVVNGLDVPWEIKWGPDSGNGENFLWVTERNGIVSRINVDTGEKHIILDIQDVIYDSNEAGLLGMEIHPEFNNGYPYVFLAYTYVSQGAREKIVCYEYDVNIDQLINEIVLVDGIDGNSTHVGCRMLAMDDLTMLITTGDAQEWMLSEDVNELTGKTLRMSIDIGGGTLGDAPEDNPIPGSLVWSWGHRNAQGLTMGPNGIIYSSEHGPSNDDELNVLISGQNFGWPNVQGYCDDLWVDYGYAESLSSSYSETDYCNDNNIIDAIWSSGSTTIAPSDITWYDHPSIPEFENTLLMTVLKNKMLVRFEMSEDGQEITSYTEFFNNEWGRLRDICVSPDGKIYLATNGYSWPSQGPNEIIELYNADYNNTNILEFDSESLIKYSFDLFGRTVNDDAKGIRIEFDQNGVSQKYLKIN